MATIHASERSETLPRVYTACGPWGEDLVCVVWRDAGPETRRVFAANLASMRSMVHTANRCSPVSGKSWREAAAAVTA